MTILTSGVDLSDALTSHVRARMGAKLGKFAFHIEHVSVRFVDLNGPKRGVDKECRIKVAIHPLPTVVVRATGIDARSAFDVASTLAVRAVQRSLERADFSEGRTKRAARKAPRALKSPNPAARNGSRVGKNRLEGMLARPEKTRRDKQAGSPRNGARATDRRAGVNSTAGRNTRKRAPKAAVVLEDSATGKPSRKSTRKGAHHLKSGETLDRQARDAAVEPQARAAVARVRRK